MNKNIIKTINLVIFVLLFSIFISKISADVIPEDSHFVGGCAKITNIDDFPEYTFIGEITGPMIIDNQGRLTFKNYIIDKDKCLNKGYKHNFLKVFAVKNTFLQNKDIADLNLSNLSINNNQIINLNIDKSIFGGYVLNSDKKQIDLIKKSYFYKIYLDDTSNKLKLYKHKTVLEYKTNIEEITYSKDGEVIKNPEPKDNQDINKINIKEKSNNIFSIIKNFFLRLFR